jgi:hypothetical protein
MDGNIWEGLGIGNFGSIFGNVLDTSSGFIDGIDSFMVDRSIDVMYKAIAVVTVLFGLYFIPATTKFATWATFILLLLLMLQSSPTGYTPTPASSTLPLPTQIGTAVPQQQTAAQQSQQGSSGSNPLMGIINTLTTIASFFF